MGNPESPEKQGHILADRYEILSEIGRGGFGMVYRARQLNMNREVAIKVLPPQFMSISDVVERFKREAQLASRLKHPNTITIHDYGQADNLLYIVMELLDGEDLADLLKREHKLGVTRLLDITRQVLKSLSEAHEKGIVHRDLKPENIYLTRLGGEDEFVKVLDFGIAKLAQPDGSSLDGRRLTVTGSTVGTPVYMSPEQAAGEEVDPLTDLYALGVIMYEMACGAPPFSDDNPVKVMRSHLFSEVPPFPTSSSLAGSHIERMVMRALQKEKKLRFQSAREFLAELDKSRPHITALPASLLSPSALRPPPAAAAPKLAEVRTQAAEEEDEPPTIELTDTSVPEEEEMGALLDSDEARFRERLVSTGEHAIKPMTDPERHTREVLDAIPFGPLSSLEPPRERIREGSLPLTTAEGSDLSPMMQRPEQPWEMAAESGPHASGLNTTSSILSIIEHAPQRPDEVFLLTQPKKPTLRFEEEIEEGKAPQRDDAAPSAGRKPTREKAPSEGWSWNPETTLETRKIESGAYPQLKQKREQAQQQRSGVLKGVLALLVVGGVVTLAILWGMGILSV